MRILRARREWVIGSGAILLAAFAFLLHENAHVADRSVYFQEIDVLRRIKQLDAEVELDVLRSRLGQQGDYDTIAANQEALTRLAATLGSHAMERSRDDEVLAGKWSALRQALQKKAGLVEEFKTANAVLRNSTAFLPAAAEEALTELGASRQPDGPRADHVRKLLVDSLLHLEGQVGPTTAQMNLDLAALESRLQVLDPSVREASGRFLAHARAVTTERAAVRNLMDTIAVVPTALLVDRINQMLDAEERQAKQSTERLHALLKVVAAALAALLVYALFQLLKKHRHIGSINLELQEANARLEARVEERTRELRSARDELLATARRAGMAEVATNVLHNVGNILNSVNVSADVIAHGLKSSGVSRLARATELLSANASRLGYLTEDEKGKLLPQYLAAASRELLEEHDRMEAELRNLVRSIDHIKSVVATQQCYARANVMLMPVHVGDLIEDALRINESAQPAPDLTVVKEFVDLPVVRLDRDRVLQILVNLISNAKHAMNHMVACERKLTLRLAASADRLRVCVADAGEGIAPENLARIFTHGFTTRSTGHGFGLHSCALAAKQMGGSLHVHSDGPGHGASFTLELPFNHEGQKS